MRIIHRLNSENATEKQEKKKHVEIRELVSVRVKTPVCLSSSIHPSPLISDSFV